MVLQGSSTRVDPTPTLDQQALRAKLIDTGVLWEQDGRLVFQKDHLFNSPSGAATIVTARRANGWMEWKYEQGRTMSEVKRQ